MRRLEQRTVTSNQQNRRKHLRPTKSLIGYQVRRAFIVWRKWREPTEAESAANECRILKRKWMRTVPEFVPRCAGQPERPRTSSIIERGKHLKLRRIWNMDWCREGELNP